MEYFNIQIFIQAPLLNPYPEKHSVVVMDNCSIHHDEEVCKLIEDECGEYDLDLSCPLLIIIRCLTYLSSTLFPWLQSNWRSIFGNQGFFAKTRRTFYIKHTTGISNSSCSIIYHIRGCDWMVCWLWLHLTKIILVIKDCIRYIRQIYLVTSVWIKKECIDGEFNCSSTWTSSKMTC